MSRLKELFDKHDEEFIQFERIPVEQKLHRRADLCAMLYLDKKLYNERDVRDAVASAEHDKIWLQWGENELDNLTEEDIIYLLRCGVMYDEDTCSLAMFV